MTKKIVVLAAIIALYNLYFFPFHIASPGRLDFLVIVAAALASLWTLFWPEKWSRKEKIAAGSSSLALFTAVLAVYHASRVDQLSLGAVSIALSLMSTYALLLKSESFGGLVEVLKAPLEVVGTWIQHIPFYYAKPEHLQRSSFIEKVRSGFNRFAPSDHMGKKVVRGLILTVPIAVLVMVLLLQADPIFSGLLNDVFKAFNFKASLLTRLLYSALLLVVLIPVIHTSITTIVGSPTNSKKWAEYPVEALMLVTTIAAILGLFLLVQFRYLFVSVPETELHKFGINTYSEYVRKGFSELLVVTAITYTVAGLAYLVHRVHQVNKTQQRLRAASTFLLIETALFVVSIFRRVFLYQADHGLTRIRIYGMAFVIYLLILVVLLLLRFYQSHKKPWYVYEIGLGVLLLAATVWWKPDYQIATRYKPTVNEEIDYVYITRLSADALPGWVEAYNHTLQVWEAAPATESATVETTRSIEYAFRTAHQLQTNYAHLVLRYGTLEEYMLLYEFAPALGKSPEEIAKQLFDVYGQKGWLEFNQAEKDAYEALKTEIDPSALRDLESQLEQYLKAIPRERRPERLDRSFDSPLL